MTSQPAHGSPHTRPAAQIKCLGELGYAHRPLLDAVTDEVIPARLPEFHLMGLDDVVISLNKLGWVELCVLGGIGEGGGVLSRGPGRCRHLA